MRLVIDVGNTMITCGVWQKNKLKKIFSVPTKNYEQFNFDKHKVKEIVYSSVVPHVDPYFRVYFVNTNFIPLNYQHIKNISINMKNKQEIGIDRLVNAAGVAELYSAPAIIIDLGTATTFCILDEKKTYQGGLICPGINLTRMILHEKTAKLPLIEISKQPKNIIGKNTVEAMQSGIIIGYQSMIEGIILKLKKQLNTKTLKYKVIVTGGYAELICKNLNVPVDIIDTDLTLKSLNFLGNLIKK